MKASTSSAWQWPTLGWKLVLSQLGIFTVIGLWQGNTTYLTMLGDRSHICWGKPFLWELTGSWSIFLGAYLPFTATLNTFKQQGAWWRFFGIHGAACLLLAAICPPIFLVMRHALYPMLGWGHYSYGPLGFRLPMEWQKIVISYIIISGVCAFSLHVRESRKKALRESELFAKLQEARLQALSAQLDPHFLFNALNTISSVMYEDLERTDCLLASLGQMLRDGLESGTALWSLERERAHLEAFLDFAMARFGDRLVVHRELAPGLGSLRVPRFCLQRLVENSLKHNLDRNGQSLLISIRVWLDERGLNLEVQDNGAGFELIIGRPGLGLANLRETLVLSYGSDARLETGNIPEGGARVCLLLPLEGRHD
jgi:two-component system, LytTR family, sensor kinase